MAEESHRELPPRLPLLQGRGAAGRSDLRLTHAPGCAASWYPRSTMPETGRAIERRLDDEQLTPEEALASSARRARGADVGAARRGVPRRSGRSPAARYGASWDVAERAAFVLLEVAREADAPAERAALLHAMGRGFRNIWLMPYVHRRLSEDDETRRRRGHLGGGRARVPGARGGDRVGFLGAETSPRCGSRRSPRSGGWARRARRRGSCRS